MDAWKKKLKKISFTAEEICDLLEEVKNDEDSQSQAEKLACLSEELFEKNQLLALELIDCAVHLAPMNQKVLQVLGEFKLLEEKSTLETEEIRATRSVASLKTDKTQVGMIPKVKSRKTVSVVQGERELHLDLHPIFSKLLDKIAIDDELCVVAQEFSNSLEGAVHFLNYLYSSSKISVEEFKLGAKILFEEISNHVTEIRARARYNEIIESILVELEVRNSG